MSDTAPQDAPFVFQVFVPGGTSRVDLTPSSSRLGASPATFRYVLALAQELGDGLVRIEPAERPGDQRELGIQPVATAYGRPRRPIRLPADPRSLEYLAAAAEAPTAPDLPISFLAIELDGDRPSVAVGVAACVGDPTRVTFVELDGSRREPRAVEMGSSHAAAALRLAIAPPVLAGPDRRGIVRHGREADGQLRLDWHAARESVSMVLDGPAERLLQDVLQGVSGDRPGLVFVAGGGLAVWLTQLGYDSHGDMACLVRDREHLTSVPRSALERAVFGWEAPWGPRAERRRRRRPNYRLVVRLERPGDPGLREAGSGWVASFADPALAAWGETRDDALLGLEEALADLVLESIRFGRRLPGRLWDGGRIDFENA